MRKRELLNKAIAAGGTIVFLVFVRTDAHPTLWQVGMCGILMYEAFLLITEEAETAARKSRRRKAIRDRRPDAEKWFKYNRSDAARWADEWFNPLHEVTP